MLMDARFDCQDYSLVDRGQIKIAEGVIMETHLEDD